MLEQVEGSKQHRTSKQVILPGLCTQFAKEQWEIRQDQKLLYASVIKSKLLLSLSLQK